MTDVFEVSCDALEELETEVSMRVLTSTEEEAAFDAVPLFQESTATIQLGFVIVCVGVGAEFQLFHFHNGLLLLGLFLLFVLLVLIFSEVEDFADGRFSIRRNFNQI